MQAPINTTVGLSQGMESVTAAVTMAKAHNDHAQVTNAINSANQQFNTLLHGGIDPETGQPATDQDGTPIVGYLTRQNADAAGIHKEFVEDMQLNLKDIRDSLQSDSQRAAFDARIQKHALAYETAVGQHELQQTQAYQLDVTKAAIQGSFDIIAANPDQPEIVSQSIDDGMAAQKTLLERQGIHEGSDPYYLAMHQYESSAHKVVIDTLLKQGRATQAKAYFDEFNKTDPEYDADGKIIPGTDGSAFTHQDASQIESYLKPLSDQQEMATAVKKYYVPGGNVMDAIGKAEQAFPDDPYKQQQFIAGVNGQAAQYHAAVASTTTNSSNVIYQAMLKNPNATIDQLSQDDPKVADAVKTVATYDARTLNSIQDSLAKQATKNQGDTLIQAIDIKLITLVSQGRYPGASMTSWPEFKQLQELDPERAKQMLEHEQGQANADVAHRKSLALMDQQAQLLKAQQAQAKQFSTLLANPALLQTANPVGLQAVGAIDATQAALLEKLQKQKEVEAKGQPVSWSADSINKTVKGLLGYKGTLSAEQEQITENAAASFSMYLFNRERSAGGPLNALQVEQASQDWIKSPAMITPLIGVTATETTMGEAIKKPDRFLGSSDAYKQVYEVAQKNKVPLTVGQARKAVAAVAAGGLK
jgi:hypothetical protein